jgi:hypothetical protein
MARLRHFAVCVKDLDKAVDRVRRAEASSLMA